MAIELKTGEFACLICGERYSTSAKADTCKISHEMLYIPMTKTEVNRLLNAIILGDLSLIQENTIETLRKYARAAVIS